jgi:hypothetical protein
VYAIFDGTVSSALKREEDGYVIKDGENNEK